MTTERDKKRHLSHSYFTDSEQLLHRAVKSLEDPLSLRTSYRGKIATDLIMSIECALKSLLCTSSPDSETVKELYSRLLGFSHHLTKLADALVSRSVTVPDGAKPALDEIYPVGVRLRYALDTFTEIALGDKLPPSYDFTEEAGMQRLNSLAETLSKFAKAEMQREFSELVTMMGSDIPDFYRELALIARKS